MTPFSGLNDHIDQAEQHGLRWISDAGDIVVALMPYLIIITSAALIVRHVLVVKARTDRRQVTVIPSSEFDPHIEEVTRFCSQLGRVRTAVNQLRTPRTTRTIRMSLISGPDGMMGQQISVPSTAFHLIKKTGFAEVETTETPVADLFDTKPKPKPKPKTDEPVGEQSPMVVSQAELDASESSTTVESEFTHREDLATTSTSAKWACLD